MQVTFRRIFREIETERWLIYSENNEQCCIDVVIIIFTEGKNLIYLFSNDLGRLDNMDYLTSICNLVHDLPIEFELLKRPLDKEPTEVPVELLMEKLL